MNENLKRFVPLIITLFIVLCVLLAIVYLIKTYQQIHATQNSHESHLAKFLKTNFDVDEMSNFTLYTDEKSYEIASAIIDDEPVLVFNPIKNDDKEKAIIYDQKELVNVEKMEEDWTKSCDTCKLKKSNMAMIDQEPVWEFTYLDAEDNYVLEYVSLIDGDVYEKLKLQN